MKTTLYIVGGLALGAALLVTRSFAQPGAPSGSQSCCGGGDMQMQHMGQQADKPVVAKVVKGVQVATITIDGGYHPGAIQVKKGTPVELTFKGGKNIGCGGTVVFKSLKISKDVTTGKSIAIKFTPKEAGEIPFTCGMGMLKGKVIVK